MGFANLEIKSSKTKVVDMGIIKMNHLGEQQLKLKKIFEELQKIIAIYKPAEMAIEAPFFGKNVQSMLKLGRAQGVAIAAGITKGLDITEYSPKKIKMAVTGNGNASKEQVSAMLKTILQVELDDQYLDATDALATALCHFYQGKNLPGAGKKYKDWSGFLKDNPGRKG